jgi:class 3 adenylate cyclase
MESSEVANTEGLDPRAPSESTVLFVDLVRFTSLTSVHGDSAAADAALALYDIAQRSLGASGRMIKTLGDGVLLAHPTPTLGLQCAGAIIERLHDLDNGLDARCGADHGPVVERSGDVFGSGSQHSHNPARSSRHVLSLLPPAISALLRHRSGDVN